MFAPRSVIGTALLITAAFAADGVAQMSDDRPRSTTDTVEYCNHLSRRFAAVAPDRPPHPPAAVMAAEGNRLCQLGHMRPGILRLRRALLLLDQPREP